MALKFYTVKLTIKAITPFTILADSSYDLSFLQYTVNGEYLYWLDKSIYYENKEIKQIILNNIGKPVNYLKQKIQEVLPTIDYSQFVLAKIKIHPESLEQFKLNPPLNIRTLPYTFDINGKPKFFIPGSSIKGMLNSISNLVFGQNKDLYKLIEDYSHGRIFIVRDISLNHTDIIIARVLRKYLDSGKNTKRGIPQNTILVKPKQELQIPVIFRLKDKSNTIKVKELLTNMLIQAKQELLKLLSFEINSRFPHLAPNMPINSYNTWLLEGNENAKTHELYYTFGFGSKKIKVKANQISFLKLPRGFITTTWTIKNENNFTPLGIVKLTFDFEDDR